MVVDLNSDVGEGFGAWSIGADRELMPLITSANIACGFHAGDPDAMRATVDLARRHGVAVGAHPGYPDRQGFGRRRMDLTPAEIESAVLYQIGAIYAFTRAAGVPLAHVKPHGALYNFAARDPAASEAIARAVRSFSAELILVGLAGSLLIKAAEAAGIPHAAEAFVDRAYAPDGSLRPRTLPGAVLTDPQAAVAQAVGIARDGAVRTPEGSIAVHADTLCLHGDTPGAVQLARAVREGLTAAGVQLRPLKDVLGSRQAD
jgi:UPF0271 protein